MDKVETIEMLRATILEQEETIRREEERIRCMRERCEKSAELICLLNAQSMAECSCEGLSKSLKGSSIEGPIKENSDDSMNKNLDEKLLALAKDEKIWPHIHCRMEINLRERLWKLQLELKCLENKMLDGTRAQLRKWSAQMEEMNHLRERMEQALLSVESWEKLYLMFMDDMDIRRCSGMDERFYQMELQDIRQKLNTCREFYETVAKGIEASLLLRDQEFLGSEKSGSLSEEIITEIRRYAVGILFLEDHLYKRGEAEDKKNSSGRTLERMEKEYEFDQRRLSQMQFAY